MRENVNWVERKITGKQLKMIWTLARQLGMDNELLHEMVFNVVGKDSLKKLTVPEAIGIIDGLIDDGARVRRKRIKRLRVGPNVIELLTGKQIRLIEYLVDQLGWNNPNQLTGFNRRVIKKERICTKQEASKIIEGLKAMVNRKGRKEVKNI
ncbi:MAG TPA: phage protein GemA/Gp16 family protein [Desulfatiglandales bacterium]|nr:phage protein GemA/Gp16 family protein [Desulfatiglandales bacterium]